MGSKGNGDGQLEQVKDIDLDKDGNIYAADSGNNRIAIFALDGKFIANAGAGKIEKPLLVEVDTAGNIYVIQQGKPDCSKSQRIPKVMPTLSSWSKPCRSLTTSQATLMAESSLRRKRNRVSSRLMQQGINSANWIIGAVKT